jgi:type II secretory pathway pseudopilin PulG
MNWTLRTGSAPHRALCLVLAALMLSAPTPLVAQVARDPQPPTDTTLVADPAATPEPLDLSYAAPDACAIVAVRPAQVLGSPFATLYPTEVLQAAMMQELGLDPLANEQLVFAATPPLAGPPSYSLVAKFNKPVTLKTDAIKYPTEEATTAGGVRLIRSTADPTAPNWIFPDATTLVAVDSASLSAAMGKRSTELSGLAARFAAAAQGDDLLAMVDVEPLRPLIGMGLMQAPIPEEMAALRNIPNLIKFVELRLNFSRPASSELVVTANSETDAQLLVAMFEQAKQTIAAQFAEEAAKALASDDPVEQATGRYTQRMIGYWNDQLKLVQEDGGRLVLFRTNPADDGQQVTQIAIIGVLVALLLPAVQAAREAARRNQSMNNLKQINLGMLNYESARGEFPAQANFGPDGKPLLSWRVHVLPYMEQQALYEQFHLDEPWDSEHNRALISQMPAIYRDPSSGHEATSGMTNYLGVAGEGRFFDGTREGRSFAGIRDGSSNTIMVVQVNDDRTVEWTRPEDWEMDSATPLVGLGNLHPGIFLAGFCDGHVSAVSTGVDLEALKAMLTIAGGEVVPGY